MSWPTWADEAFLALNDMEYQVEEWTPHKTHTQRITDRFSSLNEMFDLLDKAYQLPISPAVETLLFALIDREIKDCVSDFKKLYKALHRDRGEKYRKPWVEAYNGDPSLWSMTAYAVNAELDKRGFIEHTEKMITEYRNKSILVHKKFDNL